MKHSLKAEIRRWRPTSDEWTRSILELLGGWRRCEEPSISSTSLHDMEPVGLGDADVPVTSTGFLMAKFVCHQQIDGRWKTTTQNVLVYLMNKNYNLMCSNTWLLRYETIIRPSYHTWSITPHKLLSFNIINFIENCDKYWQNLALKTAKRRKVFAIKRMHTSHGIYKSQCIIYWLKIKD